MEKKRDSLSFKYIFPSDLKELHINGAYGGIDPHGMIRMAVYSERAAIANIEERSLNPDGTLGEVIDTDKKYDVVRVVQSSLAFNVVTARSLIKWLEERIKDNEALKEESAKKKKAEEPK